MRSAADKRAGHALRLAWGAVVGPLVQFLGILTAVPLRVRCKRAWVLARKKRFAGLSKSMACASQGDSQDF